MYASSLCMQCRFHNHVQSRKFFHVWPPDQENWNSIQFMPLKTGALLFLNTLCWHVLSLGYRIIMDPQAARLQMKSMQVPHGTGFRAVFLKRPEYRVRQPPIGDQPVQTCTFSVLLPPKPEASTQNPEPPEALSPPKPMTWRSWKPRAAQVPRAS